MLTIFSIPKAFRGHIGIIQRNALGSWMRLRPAPEILLFGNDEGTATIAAELGLRHIPEIGKNQWGSPLLSDMFRKAEAAARFEVMCYVNADILLPAGLTKAVEQVRRKAGRALIVSKRINVDVSKVLEFGTEWEKRLRETARAADGGPTAIDMFVFAKGTYDHVPDFAIGRLWFDQWLIKAALQRRIAVVDVSEAAPVLHQNHDYNHVAGGAEQVWRGPEPQENLRLYGSAPHTYTLLDATHKLTAESKLRRVRLRRPVAMLKEAAWSIFVQRTVRLRDMLGLRRKYWRSREGRTRVE